MRPIQQIIRHFPRETVPELCCACVIAGMLIAGLAPFRSPLNGVRWLEDRNGVAFGSHGIILGSEGFTMPGSGGEASLEIWLKPDRTRYSGTIIDFRASESGLQFNVRQYFANLIVSRQNDNASSKTVIEGLEGTFRQSKPLFVTITSGLHQSAIYVDGRFATAFPQAQIAKELRGELALGTSFAVNDNWRGELRGLAVYDQALPSDRVFQHYIDWTKQGRPNLSPSDGTVALYLFNEHEGGVIHNAIGGGMNLYIPERYSLPHQVFLEPFWAEYRASSSHLKDALVNIVGFMPLGFVFYAYWTLVRPIQRATLLTILLGLTVSLTIELLQSLLPTRNSGTTDLITNTLGTFVGIRFYDWNVARALASAVFRRPSDWRVRK